MRFHRQLVFPLVGSAVAILLVAAPCVAVDPVIASGIDVWHTAESGATYTDLSQNPIPADFFCSGSQPFSGRIHFRGGPLATDPPGALGGADTVIQRLDDAVFDDTGVARTRLQVKALSLVGVEPLEVGCGRFEVRASLAGEQPITEMKIVREGMHGGTYEAPLDLAVRLTFTPIEGDAPPLELIQNISLQAIPDAPWSTTGGPGHVRRDGFVVVDTDGDRTPDLNLPGTTRGFVAGRETPGTRDLDRLFRAAGTMELRSVDSRRADLANGNGDRGGLRLATGAAESGQVEPIQCCFTPDGSGCWWEVCHCTPEEEEPTTTESCLDCKHYHCVLRFAECANACSRQVRVDSPQ